MIFVFLRVITPQTSAILMVITVFQIKNVA